MSDLELKSLHWYFNRYYECTVVRENKKCIYHESAQLEDLACLLSCVFKCCFIAYS